MMDRFLIRLGNQEVAPQLLQTSEIFSDLLCIDRRTEVTYDSPAGSRITSDRGLLAARHGWNFPPSGMTLLVSEPGHLAIHLTGKGRRSWDFRYVLVGLPTDCYAHYYDWSVVANLLSEMI